MGSGTKGKEGDRRGRPVELKARKGTGDMGSEG